MTSSKEFIGPSSPKQEMILNQNADIAIVGGAMGCMTADAEYLTPNGWKRFDEYREGDKVAAYSPDNDCIVFEEPQEYIKLPCNKFRRIQARGLDFALSSEHRVVYWPTTKSKKPSVISFEEMLRRHESSLTKGWTGKIKTSFKTSSRGVTISEGDLRLAIAVQADGKVVKGGKDNYTQFRFSKVRKYERLLNLCEKFDLRYDDRGSKVDLKYANSTEYEVVVWPNVVAKEFPKEWYGMSQEQLAVVVDEVFHWDGCIPKEGDLKTKTFSYYSKSKSNVDFIQFALASMGYNTHIYLDHRDCWSLNASKTGGGYRSFVGKGYKQRVTEIESEDGFKYCFSVSTGMLVVRYNNKVFVTGNSGKSYMALLYPLRYASDPYFRGIIFRRTVTEIIAQGGLWETACELYTKVFGQNGIKIHQQSKKITFPSGGSVKFSHLDTDKDKLTHQGSQYTFILFDEATHWQDIEKITYLHIRLRSARASHQLQLVMTCNPDPDWPFLEWFKWYLHEDGTPDEEKAGVLRYYIIRDGDPVWGNSRQELIDKYNLPDKDNGIQSFTFIPANCHDNPILLENDKDFLNKLLSKPEIDIQRYYYGKLSCRV